ARDTLNGNFYELLFENKSSSKATICASVDHLTGVGKEQKVQWFDMENDVWIDAKETIEVELNPNQSQVQVVAIGGDQFFREFVRKFQRSVLSLKSIYPNPFGRVFTIKYSLPYQVQNLSFVMFNIRGQQVWKKDVINYRPGVSQLRIDQKVAAGAYILQMRAKIEGASPKVFNRMIMCTK
ncbi:MAG: T9SS type A sorting domain-containing protein, partial [Fibrobacter sp.]|nr:T9SS type A sorting domain-containing protein [Fibrobacter sp.]